MDNGETNALSRLPSAVFLVEGGVADMVAIADAHVDSAKWHNVNMYCKKRDVTRFYEPKSNAAFRMENIVSAQDTSSSTSGGTLLLMTNMVAGHMCQMTQHSTVGKQRHLSFDFMEEHLDTIVLYGGAIPSTWQQKPLCSELAIALTRTLQECKGVALVMVDTNSVWRTLDRTGGVKYTYDESTDSVCTVLLRLGLQDLHALRHPNRQDFIFCKQGQGISRIDAFWANSKLIDMVDLLSLKAAVATLPGPFYVDPRAIAVNMNLNLRYDRQRGVLNVIDISPVERPRRGKTLQEKKKMIFRDALNHDNMYEKSVETFLKGQSKAWEIIVRVMLALEMKNWVICCESIRQSRSLDVCVKGEEDGKTAQQIMGNMRAKPLDEAAKVLCDIVQGQVSVDLTKRREQFMHAPEVFVEDLHRHIMRAHAKAIKSSGPAAGLKTDRNVYLPFLL